MPDQARTIFEDLIATNILSMRPMSGGSISKVYEVVTSGGSYCLKVGESSSGMLKAEALGLEELGKAPGVNVPRVLAVNSDGLVMEFVHSVPAPPSQADLGRMLANLHQVCGDAFGWDSDNFIGHTPQKNTPSVRTKSGEGWSEFFWQYRLEPQWRRAESKGLVSRQMSEGLAELSDGLAVLIADTLERPSLLHGDLWGGNVVFGDVMEQTSKAYLIDPAVYYGHREADLAMTSMFGGFTQEFYAAYEEVLPLAAGYWGRREKLYQLYHILNHVNLFGRGYLAQAEHALAALK